MLRKLFFVLSLCCLALTGRALAAQSPDDMIRAARELIGRVTPGYENQYVLEVIPATPQGEDLFEVEAKNGKVVLRGNNPVALASAFNWYLKYTCRAQTSWFGNQLDLPATLPLPEGLERRVIQGKYRAQFNYCTISYTAAWWDWERWQQEIDYMAMNGINMPLQPIGLDAVWYHTLREIGFTDLEARTFLVGPAHQAWQWMTNIEQFGGPLPLSWIESHTELGRQIFARELELGMQPIQQCFVGVVPNLMKEKFPEANIAQQPEWYGFEGVAQLDPLDPLFQQIGKIYLAKQRELFGSHGFYGADPFHESAPPVRGDEYLSAAGETVYKLIDEFDPDGMIMMQAWSLREPIVKAFPKEKLIILDLNGSRYARTGFWGYPFITGNLHNFGGRINMHGDLPLLASNQYLTATEVAPNVIGSGMFMEAIEQNPVYYAMAFEMPMHSDSICPECWLAEYTIRAYGAESEAAKKAWMIMLQGPYGPGTNGTENSSIIGARPALKVKKSGPNSGFDIPYDPLSLYEAQRLLLSDAARLGASPIYRFDLVDLQRQIMTNLGQEIHKAAAGAYLAGDMESFRLHSGRFLELLLDADRMLASRTEYNFDKWVSDARSWGQTTAEKDLFEYDATSLVTYWGFTPGYECIQFDYSWREWSGLIRRYYHGRWKMFYDMLEETAAAGTPYSEEGVRLSHGREAFRANDFYDKLADWEIAFSLTPKDDIDPAPRGDEIELAGEMFAKYSELAKEYYP